MSAIFYLGTDNPGWLARTDVPLFVSDTRLRRLKTMPRAVTTWALDSGGFSEIKEHGRWTVPAGEYVARVRRYRDEIGSLQWAAIQDWMCEPFMLKKTGLTVEEHQRRTIDSLVQLRLIAPDVPWTPVLQGWHGEDYERHVEMYAARGIDLKREPIVGIGSVCRRQHMHGAVLTIKRLSRWHGLRLHGFGFKTHGLLAALHDLASADSLAWSYHARRSGILLPGHNLPGPGRPRGHQKCSCCYEFAMLWRAELLRKTGAQSQQLVLDIA